MLRHSHPLRRIGRAAFKAMRNRKPGDPIPRNSMGQIGMAEQKKRSAASSRRAMMLPFLALVLLGCGSLSAQTWTLAWSSEFNGPAGSAPNPAKWTYETGNNNGWGNQEQEYYCPPTDNTAPCSTAQPNIYEDGNGHLVIAAIHTSSGVWTSGRMKTQGLFTTQYGRIEASMQLPTGAGLWPAFWMLGSDITSVNWPACGELDIMENVPPLGASTVQASVHATSFNTGNPYTLPSGQTVANGFHVYGVIWSPYLIQYYVDSPSNVFATITPSASGSWPFNQDSSNPNPFFLLLNLAVGGSWPGPPDATTPTPAPMLVDYVRVYTPSAVPAPVISGNGFSISAGQSGTATLSLTGQPGTTGKVYLACSSPAAETTCSIAPNVVDFTSSNTGSAALTLTTAANSGLPPAPTSGPASWPWLALLASLGIFTLVLRRAGRVWRVRIAGWGLLAAALLLAGCGGGAAPAPPSPAPSGGTPAGNYNLTVTAYTVSGATSTASIPITVQ